MRAAGGFNRDIVECKGPSDTCIVSLPIDLIETLWNVKTIAPHIIAIRGQDLIETLWNVKLKNS